MANDLRGDDYRKGALERLNDAFILLRADQFAGSASEAGRAVEGMLRAVIWKRDADVRLGRKSLDTGHDLRELLIRVRDLGLLVCYVESEAPTTAHPAARLARSSFQTGKDRVKAGGIHYL